MILFCSVLQDTFTAVSAFDNFLAETAAYDKKLKNLLILSAHIKVSTHSFIALSHFRNIKDLLISHLLPFLATGE